MITTITANKSIVANVFKDKNGKIMAGWIIGLMKKGISTL